MTEISNLQAEFARILSAAQNGTTAASGLHGGGGGNVTPAPPPPTTFPAPAAAVAAAAAAAEPPPPKYGWVRYVALGCLVAVVAVVVCACLRRSGQANENISPPHWDKLRADDGGTEMYNIMLQQSAGASATPKPPAQAASPQQPQAASPQQPQAASPQQPQAASPQQPQQPQAQAASPVVLPAKHPPRAALQQQQPPPPPQNVDENFTTIQQLMAQHKQ